MNKTAIKNFAVWARQKLISESIYKAGLVGITEKEILSPLPQSQSDIQFFDIGTSVPVEVRGGDISKRNALATKITEKAKETDYKTAFEFVIEEVAYTWFNRLIAIRFMEVNEYLPSGIRVLSSETAGKNEPDIVTNPFDTDIDFSDKEKELVWQLKDKNKLDELFRFLFIKQCNKLNEVLPNLFEKTNNYTELLLSISFTDTDGVLRHLVNDISEEDFGEAVEIIGWLYQYYNEERKNQVINIYKGIVKKDDIPAATQLFTTDWVVRYMVDNSLGKYWIERNPSSKLAEKLKYFVTPKNGQINYIDEKATPEEMTFFDPCMGSGHILVYAFDVLMEIYAESGYTERDAVASIIENNLFGLDIDTRAYQLAYFALMMKARSKDRRFLTRDLSPQVYCPQNSEELENMGSILEVNELGTKPIQPDIISFENLNWEQDLNNWNFKRLLTQKYAVVCTNPPYLNKFNPTLKKYVTDNYKDYSGDLFSVFIYKNFDYCKLNGYSAFMTPFVWMFIKTYEKLREYIINSKSITSLIQMEYSAFEEATVPICSFILKNGKESEKGLYFKLSDFKGGMEVQKQKVLEALANKECGCFYETSIKNFTIITNSPISFWGTSSEIATFNNGIQLSDIGETRQGMASSDDARFVRVWHEVFLPKVCFTANNSLEAMQSSLKWFPYNKGGSYRKWYGNNTHLVNYELDGKDVKAYAKRLYKSASRTIKSQDVYFKAGGTWSAISSGSLAVRWFDNGFVISNAGMALYADNKKELLFLIALLNSHVVSKSLIKLLNESLNFNAGDISRIPIIIDETKKDEVDDLVQQNISISKTDWDSFETSWDFVRHPLIKLKNSSTFTVIDSTAQTEEKSRLLQFSYNMWQNECEERFNQLKANEEELNRIFIDIYGLQDELTPKVEDKDVTVRLADKTRDIKSFISYAVGCMFGRYSLDVDGLAYAGGNFNDTYWLHKGQAALNEKGEPIDGGYAGISISPYNYARLKDSDKWETATYLQFSPDYDNCLPITDEEYFSDDIVGRFVDFVKVVYGDETIEQNLDFIASTLPNKGNTSRDVIRNYFLKDFYKDHVKTYQKRPIYWLYDSGKQDGFKALVYMHRYNADTTGLLRVDYLHKIQRTYENEIEHMKDNIDNNHDIAASTKRMEKLVKQLQETKEYDEKIAHLALSRIAIDLDDGVKANYEKVQTGQDGKKLDVLGKV